MATDAEKGGSCHRCMAQIPLGEKQCPQCGIPLDDVITSGTRVRPPRSWRLTRRARILATLFILFSIAHVCQLIGFRLPLRNSFLVLEAVSRANENPQVVATLGKPITVGWAVRGYIYEDQANLSTARLWIPMTGRDGQGVLYARLGRGSGPWVFAELKLSTPDSKIIDLLELHRSAGPVELQARGRTYLVPLGDVRSLGLERLPEFYRTNFGLDVELLAPLPLEASAFDATRRQFIAEGLAASMERRLPKIAKDKRTVLIGITDQDMYIREFDWRFAFNYRDGLRFAVVSSARLGKEEPLVKARVRKLVTRDIGLLVYGLPRNDDPTSPLYQELWATYDIDLASDWFEGLGARAVVSEFKEGHGQPPVPVELRTDAPTPATRDGGYPCFVLKRRTDEKAKSSLFTAAEITKCLPQVLIDVEVDEMEVNLRSGLLITRKTDLFVPDVIPLALTRCYRLWDGWPRPFGVNTNHVWDMSPNGSRQPYTFVNLVLCDGISIHYDRISKGTGYADALYEHRETASRFLGSRFGWNGNGWDLRLGDGSLLLFPEAYYAKRPVDGAIVGMRDSQGRSVRVDRDRRRNLQRITSPGGHFIDFEQNASDRIVRAIDDQKRRVTYTYDAGGRLALINGPQSLIRYSYDHSYLTAVDEDDHRLVDIGYADGRIAKISLHDGRTYRFRFGFDPKDDTRVVRAWVTNPDGSVKTIDIKPEPD